MNELRASVISQEKGIYKIQSGAAVKLAEISGVGKSTLINKLTGTDSLATREIGNDDADALAH